MCTFVPIPVCMLMMTVSLLIRVADGDEPVAPEPKVMVEAVEMVKEKPAIKTRVRPGANRPADALRAENMKREPAAVMEQAEGANVEAVAAPIMNALFGGGIMMGQVQNADDQKAQNEAMVQQFIQQFRTILTAELGFVRQVCHDLPPELRPTIKAAGEECLKDAATQMAQMQMGQMQGRGMRVTPEPRRIIREGLTKILKDKLTTEQLARYTDELTKRMEIRKRAAILSVVSRLDGCLYLQTEQRDKIVKAITEGWEDKWESWLMMSAYGDQYFPVLPDQHVVPHLTKEQKSVWQTLQRIDFGWWGGDNGQNAENDGWWGDAAGNAEGILRDLPFAIGVNR